MKFDRNINPHDGSRKRSSPQAHTLKKHRKSRYKEVYDDGGWCYYIPETAVDEFELDVEEIVIPNAFDAKWRKYRRKDI